MRTGNIYPFGFTLNVPIFNGLQTYTGYKNAQLNALSVKYSKDLVDQNLYKTIAQAFANARASLNKFNANKLAVEANEQSFYYAEQKYNVGAISTFDYNNSKTRLAFLTSSGSLLVTLFRSSFVISFTFK